MIEVYNLWFKYKPSDEFVLRDITLRIEDGKLIAILGDNGAGKTTLIKHFNGLLKPTKGVVYVDGLDTRKTPISALSRKVAIVFQYPEKTFFATRVWDEVAFPLKNFGFDRRLIERIVEKMLKTFWLWEYRDMPPFMLSGGEARRLAIATSLAWNPNYLVLDEPTAGQDAIQREILISIINTLVKAKRTVVLVTHDIEFVSELNPDVVILLSKGRVVYHGQCSSLFRNNELLTEAGLLQPCIYALESSLKERKLIDHSIDSINQLIETLARILTHD